MIHRLALLMGGAGAAGVLALALSLGGFGAAQPNTADAFVPVSNNALAGGVVAAPAPTEQPTAATSLGGGAPQDNTKKVIDTVYVLPAPAVHRGKPATDENQPTGTPRPPRDDNNGGNQAGDDQSGDDQTGDDSSAAEGDNSDDGGGSGGGETGDD